MHGGLRSHDSPAFDKIVAAFMPPDTAAMLERMLGLEAIRPDDVLTVIFTSGSTGDPKGVVLTEENVGSHVRAIDNMLHVSSADVALGVLPFFHSYGYTTTLWTPLTFDPSVVFHTDPGMLRRSGPRPRAPCHDPDGDADLPADLHPPDPRRGFLDARGVFGSPLRNCHAK
jgi:hypothetical protein